MMRSLLSAAFVALLGFSHAQVIDLPAARTIKTSKAEVTCFAIAPKGDRILVGLNKGAELIDLESGKKLFDFAYGDDGKTPVYHVSFNENGQFAVLIGSTETMGVGTNVQ
ncbi:MAG TPA: hypothetical protein PK760_00430, partial [Flavobacteriales bacterium]|nr:hypothetical protein [Flavobacteriales bacterium]